VIGDTGARIDAELRDLVQYNDIVDGATGEFKGATFKVQSDRWTEVIPRMTDGTMAHFFARRLSTSDPFRAFLHSVGTSRAGRSAWKFTLGVTITIRIIRSDGVTPMIIFAQCQNNTTGMVDIGLHALWRSLFDGDGGGGERGSDGSARSLNARIDAALAPYEKHNISSWELESVCIGNEAVFNEARAM
jgi:hypothetical protein